MPAAAAIPAITATLGGTTGLSAIGGIASGVLGGLGGGSTNLTSLPLPTPLFPGLLAQYTKQLGSAGPQGLGELQTLSQTGNLQNVIPAYQAMVAANQNQMQEGQANIEEQFGSTGLRYSKPLMTSLSDYQNQNNLNFANTLSQYMGQAQSQATQTQLSASGLLANLFNQTATTFAPTAALTPGGQGLNAAAGGLGNLSSIMLMSQLFNS